jgi:hypothetical protein
LGAAAAKPDHGHGHHGIDPADRQQRMLLPLR